MKRGDVDDGIPILSPKGGVPVDTSLLCAICDDESNPCLNDYGCVYVEDFEFRGCSCNHVNASLMYGFATGALCEKESSCIDVGCFAGGTCNGITGSCDCPEGRSGTFCDYRCVTGNETVAPGEGLCVFDLNYTAT